MPAAEQDLDAQADYIAISQDPRTGTRFIQAVHQTLELLATHPRVGRVLRMRGTVIAEMRTLQIKGFPNHLVFHQITKRGVEVLRIVHGARDLQRLFEE
jgi:toxin ParE1/3/4